MRDFVRDAEAGEHAARGWPNTCYGVSKMGVIALTRVLARAEPSVMAGGTFRTSTRPKLCTNELSPHVCMSIHPEGESCSDRGSSACSQ